MKYYKIKVTKRKKFRTIIKVLGYYIIYCKPGFSAIINVHQGLDKKWFVQT